ncbi:MAG: hypothetical protein ACQER9_01730, partial [Nanobdellota archaeon]
LDRNLNQDYSYYVNMQPVVEDSLDGFIHYIKSSDEDIEKIDYVMSFVQSINGENESDNYPKFPLEMLYDAKGDCEDSAILASRIFNSLGYQTVFIEFDSHIGIGVKTKGEGAYFYYMGEKYYYYEPTGSGFSLGEVPVDFKDEKANVYSSNPDTLIKPSFDFVKVTPKYSEPYYLVNMTLRNLGSEAEFIIIANLETKNSPEYSKRVERIFVGKNKTKYLNFSLKTPFQNTHRIIFSIDSHLSNPVYMKTKWISSSN